MNSVACINHNMDIEWIENIEWTENTEIEQTENTEIEWTERTPEVLYSGCILI